jgi:N-acetylglucosaminyldiphosphoundecaprenol N-acetyl-beta-D-mannosaminyltransferase
VATERIAFPGLGSLGVERSVRPRSARVLSRRGASGVERELINLSAGILVDCINVKQAARRIEAFLAAPGLHQVVTVNLDFLRLARADATFRETIDQADLAVADGMPLVWASRLAGCALPERVTGNALVDECCKLAARTGQRLFLLGARPGIADKAARTIAQRYPGAVVAGTFSPPFGDHSSAVDREMVERINRSGASLLFVAFGAPRQDRWIESHRHDLDVKVAMGVGCGLDLLAGAVTRAPGWMQQAGLEWLHRLRLEPRRLARRYLDDVPVFARLMAESLWAQPVPVKAR